MCVSKPKIPKPAAVIERQAYRTAAPRDSVGGTDANARRRRLQGIATSSQGDVSAASTTRNVMGGDTPLNPVIGGGGGSSVAVGPASGGAAVPIIAPPALQALARAQGYNPRWKAGEVSGKHGGFNYMSQA